jgi:hypothetical protein
MDRETVAARLLHLLSLVDRVSIGVVEVQQVHGAGEGGRGQRVGMEAIETGEGRGNAFSVGVFPHPVKQPMSSSPDYFYKINFMNKKIV